MDMKVLHKTFGIGKVSSMSSGIIEVMFGSQLKKFQFPGVFDALLTTEDAELLRMISEAKGEAVADAIKEPVTTQSDFLSFNSMPRRAGITRIMNMHNPLVGERAQTIPVSSEEEMFELVGYMATPGRVGTIEAEVPKDGRDDDFERLFPGQTYRPIAVGYTPSGLPNKLSPQFRINFHNLRNCPNILRSNMGKGNGSCVGRINKSKFVIDVVQNYGFRFGDKQNVTSIREIAAEKGYLAAFERGYGR